MDLEPNKDNFEVIGENSHLLQRKNSAEFYAAHFPHKNTTNFQVKHITNPYLRFSLRAWFRVTTALLLVVITSLACAWVNESQEIDVTTTSYETIGILLAFLLGTRSVQAAARWSDGSTKVYDGIHFILRIATRIASIPNLSDSNAKYDSRKRSNSKIRLPTALEKIQVNCKRYLKALYHVEFVQLKDLFDLDYSTVPFHYLLHEDEKSMLSKSHAPEFLLAKWLYEEVNEYDIGLEIRQDIFNFLNTWRQAKQVKDIHMKMPFEKVYSITLMVFIVASPIFLVKSFKWYTFVPSTILGAILLLINEYTNTDNKFFWHPVDLNLEEIALLLHVKLDDIMLGLQ